MVITYKEKMGKVITYIAHKAGKEISKILYVILRNKIHYILTKNVVV